MSLLRIITTLVAAVALTWSSVADNPATCLDDAGLASAPPAQDEHGAPRTPDACAQRPCRTPTDLQVGPVALAITAAPPCALEEAIVELLSAEVPSPPTPPPMPTEQRS